MNAFSKFSVLLTAAALLLAGCVETERQQATGKGHVRGVNGVVTAPAVVFSIEERSQGSLQYRFSSDGRRWDDLSYEFRFDVFEFGNTEATRLVNIPVDLVANTDYVFVLTGSIANPDFLQWTQPERIFEGTETVFETGFGHAAPQLGQVDFYLDPFGTPPAVGNERATLSFGDFSPAIELPAGDYRVTLTAPGDPSTVIFRSQRVTLQAANGTIFAIFDPSPSITGNASVTLINRAGAAADLVDRTADASARFLHNAFGSPNVDIYLDQDFANPVATNIGFGEVTSDLPLPGTSTTVTYTTSGDPADVLLESDLDTIRGLRYTAYFFGPSELLVQTGRRDDRRPRETSGRIRVVHNSSNIELIDVYVVPAGTDIADAFPAFGGLLTVLDTGYLDFDGDSYDVILTLSGEKTPISTPLALDLALGDVAELAIVDTSDADAVELVLYGN